MSNHLMTDLAVGSNTDDEIRWAVHRCVHHAVDEAEARVFAEALGLLPTVPARPEARDDMGRMRSGTYRKDRP